METPHRAVPDDLPGATVMIDGERRGMTPYVGTLSRQEPPVEIQLTQPGYLPATRKVAASADVALSLSLDRAPQGPRARQRRSRRATAQIPHPH